MEKFIREIKEEEFDQVYKIMESSFPSVERRTYENELREFNSSSFKVFVVEEKGAVAGFIKEWDLPSFNFIEHFATDPMVRGKGLGSRMLREYLKGRKKPVIIEVEWNSSQIAKRRINFYERLGFTLSDIEYIQPKLQDVKDEVLLKLMYYPGDVDESILIESKKEIFEKVYKVK